MGIAWFVTRIVKAMDKVEFLTEKELPKRWRWSLPTALTGLVFFCYHGTSGGNGAVEGRRWGLPTRSAGLVFLYYYEMSGGLLGQFSYHRNVRVWYLEEDQTDRD